MCDSPRTPVRVDRVEAGEGVGLVCQVPGPLTGRARWWQLWSLEEVPRTPSWMGGTVRWWTYREWSYRGWMYRGWMIVEGGHPDF